MADDRLLQWAQARGLELTPDNRPVVARYLRRARWLPVLGALVAVVLPTVVELVRSGELVILGFHTDGSGAPYAGPMEAYIGYLLGALCAEVSLARPTRSPPVARRASAPRELADYLPRRLLVAQRSARRRGRSSASSSPGSCPTRRRPRTPTGSALAIGAAALRRLRRRAGGARALGGAPPPAVHQPRAGGRRRRHPRAVRARHGRRRPRPPARRPQRRSSPCSPRPTSTCSAATMWLPALAAFVLSIRACRDIGQQPWRVRRSVDRRPGAAPA